MSGQPHSQNKFVWVLILVFLFLIFNIVFLIISDLPTRVTYTSVATQNISDASVIDSISSSTQSAVIEAEVFSPVEITPISTQPLSKFIEVTEGCAENHQGECLLVRSGPGREFPVVYKLRNGVVLKTSESVLDEQSGITWYKIIFDEWLRYPNRVGKAWYGINFIYINFSICC